MPSSKGLSSERGILHSFILSLFIPNISFLIFALMNIYVQITLLILTAIVTTAFFSKKNIALVIAIVFAILITFQMASVLLGGNLVDFKFINHLTFNDITFAGDFFLTETLTLAFILMVSPFFIYYLSRKWRTLFQNKTLFNVGLLLFALILMSLNGGILHNLYEIIQLKTAKDKSFRQSLNDLGIPPSQYKLPRDIKAKAGKNIIVLSLESIEKDFLADNLSHLTPNLRRLKDQLTFFDMPLGQGSHWTSGSIYTEITGFPAYFRESNNYIFQQTSEVKITGISHILKKAGYDVSYLLAGKEFSGMDAMLEAYGFEVKSDADYDYKLSEWGMHDKDLFEAAQKELLAKKQQQQPFALFISTLSTHHPDGIYDKRFENNIPPQRTKLEFMVAAVDQLIGNLFDFLEKEKILDNTAIFIFPDHLLMGLTARVIDDFAQARSLYLLTNAKANQLSYKTSERVYQIDIPKLILEGAGVEHNATFLTDFIQEQDKLNFIENNQANILALNEASLQRNHFQNGIELQWTNNNKLLLKSDSHTEVIENVTKGDSLYVFYFDKKYRLKKSVRDHLLKVFQASSEPISLIVDIKDTGIYAYLKKKGFIGIAKEGQSSITFSKKELQLFSKWGIEKELASLPTEPHYMEPYPPVYLTSSGYGWQQENTPSEIRIGSKKYPIKRGINLLAKNDRTYRVFHFDTYGDSLVPQLLIEKLDKLNKTTSFYALVVHDSANRMLKNYYDALLQRGFDVLTQLKHREAYIAYSHRGIVSEFIHPKTISLSLPLTLPQTAVSNAQIHKWAKDPNRFIAHAGGQIESYNYTNSLEALNLSYQKGFRLFELDIIKTYDGHYVAAHDWIGWKYKVAYEGKLPVTKEEFLKRKIHGKFTPLDMEAINQWFATHPDAILVTDKVNEPTTFARQFVDKKRLMMELFTLEAVQEGLKIGIKSAMPSQNVVNKIKGDKVAFLKNLEVQHIVVSRRMIEEKKAFFLALKEAGIKAYVFHVNKDEGKDEAYTVLNDLPSVYGLYADKWEINESYSSLNNK